MAFANVRFRVDLEAAKASSESPFARMKEREMELSQEDFAAECGLDRTYLGSVERGERNIALRNIEKISKALSLSIAELVNSL